MYTELQNISEPHHAKTHTDRILETKAVCILKLLIFFTVKK